MPAIGRIYQANGNHLSKMATSQQSFLDDDDEDARALANKKLQYIEEEMNRQQQKLQKAFAQTTTSQINGVSEEIFQDTCAQPAAHLRQQQQPINDATEKILIYDGQNNTSIAQTAKDQFAAALLRLQSGLDESSKRLQAVETKVDDFIKRQQRSQQQQTRAQQNNSASKRGLSGFVLNQGPTLLYLGWPIVVFLAMRAIERRRISLAANSLASGN